VIERGFRKEDSNAEMGQSGRLCKKQAFNSALSVQHPRDLPNADTRGTLICLCSQVEDMCSSSLIPYFRWLFRTTSTTSSLITVH
jgi:hypothetical protein